MNKAHLIKRKKFKAKHSNLEIGIKYIQNGEFKKAINIFKSILELDPKNYYARLNLGITLLLNDDSLQASTVLHMLHEELPDDTNVLRLTGKAYYNIGNFNLAIKFYKRAINLNPEDFETWLDLTAAAGANQLETEALYYATQALSLNPADPRAHLNLGGTLSTTGRIDDALYCFETALKLDPNNIVAKSNCALIFEKKGAPDLALAYLRECLEMSPKGSQQEKEIFYKMSFSYLLKGNLKLGWEMYEYGFDINHTLSRGPKRKFNSPKWNGDSIKGRRLLVWREQGLGDEVMFFHTLPDVFTLCSEIIIECEDRLVSIFARSFPKCTVRNQNFNFSTGYADVEDYDYHISVGSLLNIFRKDIHSFTRAVPYLIPDPLRVIDFKHRLEPYKSKKLIGICWRSGKLSAERNIHYAPISSWKPVFDLKNTVFINLQYGDTEFERNEVNRLFGINILNWDDIDLRNDLESVCALISNLDCVASVGTAVAQITGALGIHLKLLVSRDWVLLGENKYPWFNNVELFSSNTLEPVEPLIQNLATSLNNFSKS